MHFPSSSWGRLGGESMVEYNEYTDQIMQNRERIELFKKMVLDKKKPDTYKEVWEVLQMPVINPKTGEKDHVDITKVSQIIVDPVTVYNLENPTDKLKISLDLKGLGSNEVVLGATPGSAKNEQENTSITIDDFENMISECVYSESDMRLENVKAFKSRIDILISNIIHKKKQSGAHYLLSGAKYDYIEGAGLIYDEKLQREIGTFDNMTLSYSSNSISFTASHIFLQGRQAEDICKDSDSYTFVFYSTKEMKMFSIKLDAPSNLNNGSSGGIFSTRSKVTMEEFGTKHAKYDIVMQAENTKKPVQDWLIEDSSDPLADQRYEEYKESRLIIIKDSQEKSKKQKIVNQFADIDLF